MEELSFCQLFVLILKFRFRPYTPQQNRLVERRHRYVVELSLASMFHSHIPNKCWPDVFESITFVINRLPSSTISFQTPLQLLFNRSPDYKFFKVLGCKCYPYTRLYSSHKLAPRSILCVFIGYSSIYKGYKCLDLSTNRVYISRYVIFDESSFPFKVVQSSCSNSNSSTTTYPLQILPDDFTSMSIPSTTSLPPTPSCQNLPCSQLQPPVTKVYSRHSGSTPAPCSTMPSSPQIVSSHQMVTRTKSRISSDQPKALLATNHPLPQPEMLDPTTYAQASKEPHWRHAMAIELDVLAQNNTWSLVPASEATNIVGCKWVYKTKRKSDGTIERHKARLVAKGYTQEEGLDYTDTFSPVIKLTTIRLILSLVVTNNW
jgi:Reverse transcriptase (RNA-dependent DNA polymerase)